MTIVKDSFYINGQWVKASSPETIAVTTSGTGDTYATIPVGTVEEANRAVEAAAAAFTSWTNTSPKERGEFLTRISEKLAERADEIALCIANEVGMPLALAKGIQAGIPTATFADMGQRAKDFEWEEEIGNSTIVREAAGVVAAITPWNYPLHQIANKVAAALAAGCTVVLKPSEVAPINAFILAEIIHEVGLPKGVFNLITGTGPVVGEAIVAHPKTDMVSFTGSTRAGKRVMEIAAQMVKRVSLELGGKSANIILEDADLTKAVPDGIFKCYLNSGQTCSALTRMLVPRSKLSEVEDLAVAAAAGFQPSGLRGQLGIDIRGDAKQKRLTLSDLLANPQGALALNFSANADMRLGVSLSALGLPALMADLVVMKNGDRITGAIVKKDGATLTISSALFGTITMPWEQVESVNSDGPLNVVIAGSTVQGPIRVSGGRMDVAGRVAAIAERYHTATRLPGPRGPQSIRRFFGTVSAHQDPSGDTACPRISPSTLSSSGRRPSRRPSACMERCSAGSSRTGVGTARGSTARASTAASTRTARPRSRTRG